MPDQPIASAADQALVTPGEQLRGNTAEDIQDTNTALDALLSQAEGGEDQPTAEEKEAAEAADKAAAEATAAEKEAAEKAAAGDEAHDKTDEVPTPEEIAAAKEVADKKAKEAAAPEDFQDIKLPEYAKPKSVEAFTKVKTLAAQRIATVEAEKIKIAEELAATKAAAGKVDPAVEKELKELREFRLKFDVEADPQFNTFDATIKSNEELIYARLKNAGIDDTAIKRIQELGGPAHVNWEAIKDKIPESLMRYIEGKLFENEDLSGKKTHAIESAKKNASEFVKTRQEEIYKQTEGRSKQTKANFDAMVPQFEWLKPKTVPANAKPEERAALEAHNKFNEKVLADVNEALQDDSPEMRAILIAGFAQLMKVRADHDASKTAHAAEIAKLNAAIKEKDALIAGIKKSSTPRLAGRATVPGEVKPIKMDINEEPGSAIDRLFKDAQAKAE